LSQLLRWHIDNKSGMPAVVGEGAIVNQVTFSTYVTLPTAVRRAIYESILRQRPIAAGLTQQAVSAGILFNILFTPNVGAFPGVWDQLVYGVLVEIDYPQNVAKGIADVTVQGFGQFEQTINIACQTGQPNAAPGGTAKVRLWFFPGESFSGTAVYVPWSFRPVLSAAPLNVAHTLNVQIAAGLPTGAVVTAHLLTRGHIEVDTLSANMQAADLVVMQTAARLVPPGQMPGN
jgi:hypothetical protein